MQFIPEPIYPHFKVLLANSIPPPTPHPQDELDNVRHARMGVRKHNCFTLNTKEFSTDLQIDWKLLMQSGNPKNYVAAQLRNKLHLLSG